MNNGSIFSWFVQEDDSFNSYKKYMQPGSLNPGNELEKTMRIWNGYGDQDVENSHDTKLVISFKNYEDNFLLNLIKVKVIKENEVESEKKYENLNIDFDRGSIELGTIYRNSYVDVKIKIGPIPDNINSSLKSVIFYLENNN